MDAKELEIVSGIKKVFIPWSGIMHVYCLISFIKLIKLSLRFCANNLQVQREGKTKIPPILFKNPANCD